jgi:hypothetical protein
MAPLAAALRGVAPVLITDHRSPALCFLSRSLLHHALNHAMPRTLPFGPAWLRRPIAEARLRNAEPDYSKQWLASRSDARVSSLVVRQLKGCGPLTGSAVCKRGEFKGTPFRLARRASANSRHLPRPCSQWSSPVTRQARAMSLAPPLDSRAAFKTPMTGRRPAMTRG